MTLRTDMLFDAREAGLTVCTFSPGDGVTRYRFFVTAKHPTGFRFDYHHSNAIYTALGVKQAAAFAYGFRSATLQLRR